MQIHTKPVILGTLLLTMLSGRGRVGAGWRRPCSACPAFNPPPLSPALPGRSRFSPLSRLQGLGMRLATRQKRAAPMRDCVEARREATESGFGNCRARTSMS